jgi:mannose-1-phosphate guanylyltransferase
MKPSAAVWAIVLAAGEGSRLLSLTAQQNGYSAPTQFCSLHGGPTLLDDAMERAARVVARQRICPIVAAQHHSWWQPLIGQLPAGNIIVQPANRGTGIGILYAVMYVLARDPRAHIVLFPSDHFVQEEALLESALRAAIDGVQRNPNSPVLLGIEPDEADADLGYIVPGEPDSQGGHRVQRFVEKPPRSVAAQLAEQGALWNTFIIAAAGQSLIDAFFAQRFPFVMAQIEKFLSRTTRDGRTTSRAWSDLVSIYQTFPSVDFSRDILAGRELQWRVVQAPHCGWSDLGTPQRLAATLERMHTNRPVALDMDETEGLATVNLAIRHSHFGSERAHL